jgi:LuxR family transcriptional regulator, maltose regulon positive regulatory protein
MVQAQVVTASWLAILEAVAGTLTEASRIAGQCLATVDRFGVTGVAEVGWARLALAAVSCERDQLDAAGRHLAEVVSAATGQPDLMAAALTVRARLYHSMGRPVDGLRVIREARAGYAQAPLTDAVTHALTLTEAELRVGIRDAAGAHRLLARPGRPAEFATWSTATRAAALLATGRTREAVRTLGPALTTARWAAVCRVQTGLLSAAAGDRIGDTRRVLHGLELALDTAAADDIRRPFITTWADVSTLLARYLPRLHLRRPGGHAFADSLLHGASRPGGSGPGYPP